jgi:hypothetical protein
MMFPEYSFNSSRNATGVRIKFLTSYFCPLYERTIRINTMKMKSQSSSGYRGERLQALTARQARFVDAIAARILPTTDTPGAIEAGAVFYIDRALAGPTALVPLRADSTNNTKGIRRTVRKPGGEH